PIGGFAPCRGAAREPANGVQSVSTGECAVALHRAAAARVGTADCRGFARSVCLSTVSNYESAAHEWGHNDGDGIGADGCAGISCRAGHGVRCDVATDCAAQLVAGAANVWAEDWEHADS